MNPPVRVFLALLATWLFVVSPAAAQLGLLGVGPGAASAVGPSFTTFNSANTSSPGPGTSAGVAVTGSGLIVTGPSSSYGRSMTNGSAVSGDKVYFECTRNGGASTTLAIGVSISTKAIGPGPTSGLFEGGDATGFYDNGQIYQQGSSFSSDSNLTTAIGDTRGVEIDFTSSPATISFRYSNVGLSSGFLAPVGTNLYAYAGVDSSTAQVTCNFGATTFAFTPTPGFTGVLH